jgi:hypothetical protein
MKATTSNIVIIICILFTALQFPSCQKDNGYTNRVNANSNDDNSIHALPVDSSLVAWYTFKKGSLNDQSIYHNDINPKFVTATPAASKLGVDSNAYYFNGQSSSMRVRSHSSLNTRGSITIAALVKPMGFYQGKYHGNIILSKEYDDTENGRYELGFDDEPYTYDGCDKKVRENREYFYGTYGDGTGASSARDTDRIRTDKWYDIVYTCDGSVSKLYINGFLKISNDAPTSFNPNSEHLFIGMSQNGNFPYFFNGVIDEIRIYKRALSPEEVMNLDGKMGLDN